ncbi:DUF6340 family protein [Bacteroidota bacterium]
MKKSYLLIAILLTGFISGCKLTKVGVQVSDPAQIKIPGTINNMVVINRTIPEMKKVNKYAPTPKITDPELLLKIETADSCVMAIVNGLKDTPRFKKIVIGESEIAGEETSGYKRMLEWEKVESICVKNKTLAILSLELFDYSELTTKTSNEKKTKIVNNEETQYTVYKAVRSLNIVSRLRTYDPIKSRCLDEIPFNDVFTWESYGNTEEEAISGLPDNRLAILEAGKKLGEKYAERITPFYLNVERNFYNKGSDELVKAATYAKNNEWNKAAGVWTNILRNGEDSLINSYASYNMAVWEEINGQPHIALSWARKSNKLVQRNSTLKYINILNKRVLQIDLETKKLNEE